MSKKLKLSYWHSGDVKPVHVGIYERKWKDGTIVFTKWNGKYWCFSVDVGFCDAQRQEAFRLSNSYDTRTWEQNIEWRGILK